MTIVETASTLPLDALPAFVGDLEHARAIAQRRLLTPAPAPVVLVAEARPITTAELAARAGCSAWYVKELVHRKKLAPLVAGGGRHGHFRFEASDVERVKDILRKRRAR